jgi:hypothetical protein
MNIEIVTSGIEIQQIIKVAVSIDIQKYAIFDSDQKVLLDLLVTHRL